MFPCLLRANPFAGPQNVYLIVWTPLLFTGWSRLEMFPRAVKTQR